MNLANTAIIYLIPTPLSGQSIAQALTPEVIEIISKLDYFIVENAKSARAFLKQITTCKSLQELQLVELNEHTKEFQLTELLDPLLKGRSCGLLSETGVPCLADPGTNLVALAHKQNIPVVPLVGPCSIVLAITSSGLSGQNFAFCGYLPAKSPERENKIRELEKLSAQNNQAQFFIETPYRAQKLFLGLLQVCKENTKLSLGINLGSSSSNSEMKTTQEWRKNIPDLDGKLVVFGLQGA